MDTIATGRFCRLPGMRRSGKDALGSWGILVFLLCASVFPGQAQCIFDGPADIPDPGTLVIEIPVGGLTDDLLGSPTQGICNVDIAFQHEYLGDLSVILQAPDGTQVQLIGPSTTATLPTNLTQWNVSFVPCGQAAVPDAGFAAVWSNLQAWQALAFYSGSYHPYNGCLEDFNTGTANGTWQLIVEDDSEFQFGSILSVTLTFCNPDGLDCTPCLASGGALSPATVTLCEGETFDSGNIGVDFGGPAPPASIHAYEFLLIREGVILQHGPSLVLQPTVGAYSICGLSYGTEDAPLVDALLATGDSALVQDALLAGLYCGSGSSNCILLQVLDAPDSLYAGAQICAGESFAFRGVTYDTPGIFYQALDGPGECDTIARIEIGSRSLDVVIGISGELGCGQQVLAGAVASGSSAGYTFLWETDTGSILSDPIQDTISVGLPGRYDISVTDGICSGSSSVIVPEGPGYPSIVAMGGTITCRAPALTVDPVFVPASASVSWTGPNGFTAAQPSVILVEAGVYVVYAENSAGCISTDTIEIQVDTTISPVFIDQLEKDCAGGWISLAYQAGQSIDSVRWSGPGMFDSSDDTVIVNAGGQYDLQVFFANGCTTSATLVVDGDFSLPDIAVSPETDTINCGETIDLLAMSVTPGVGLSWAAPQGQTVQGPVITAIQPGLYMATALAPNGCVTRDTTALFEGSDLFDFQWVRDTLDCRTDTATIGVLSPVADLFHWIGFPGPDSLMPFIRVTQPGMYTVSMTDTLTGCAVIASLLVPADTTPPEIELLLDTVTCAEPMAELEWNAIPGQLYDTVYWVLPDLSTVGGSSISVSRPGEYSLVSVGHNGCERTVSFALPFDTLGPVLLAEPAILGCEDTVTLQALTLDSIIAWNWTGPGILVSNGPQAEVVLPGNYSVMATGLDGCTTDLAVVVDSDLTEPVVALAWDTLTCLGPSLLVGSTPDMGVSFAWYDGTGQWLGADDTLSVTEPGTYILEAVGLNGCTWQDSAVLLPPLGPVLDILTDTFTCIRTQVEIRVMGSSNIQSVTWLDLAGNTLSTQPSWTTGMPGPFEAVVTGINGCMTRDTIAIPFDTVRPVASVIQVGEIQCDQREVVLDASGSIPANGIFNWTTSDGQILGDPGLAIIAIRDTGRYILVLVDPANGCRDTAAWDAKAIPGVFGEADLALTPSGCEGDMNGSIEVLGIGGAVPPLAFSINGGLEQASGYFDGLMSGTYEVTIRDNTGCRLDTLVVLEGTPAFTVNAGEDVEIYLGQFLTLEGTTDLPGAFLQGEAWFDYFQQLCQCRDTEISPAETADYIFQVSSNTGCKQADTIRVYVIEEPNFFVPDIFSPNGDGINDEIRPVFASGVSRVRQWVIFDRWGDAVYGRADFLPNEPAVSWDGRDKNGRSLNPAVFAYWIELELTNGEVRTRYGSVTLVR